MRMAEWTPEIRAFLETLDLLTVAQDRLAAIEGAGAVRSALGVVAVEIASVVWPLMEQKVGRVQLADAKDTIARFDAEQTARLGVTPDGCLTFDGEVVACCPGPLSECRPGACNCDGLLDHWRIWHTDPEQVCPRKDTDCTLSFSNDVASL